MALEDVVRGRERAPLPGLSDQILAILQEHPQIHKEYLAGLAENPNAMGASPLPLASGNPAHGGHQLPPLGGPAGPSSSPSSSTAPAAGASVAAVGASTAAVGAYQKNYQSAENTQVRPSYASTLKGINPLFEPIAKNGGTRKPSGLPSAAHGKNTAAQGKSGHASHPGGNPFLGSFLDKGKNRVDDPLPQTGGPSFRNKEADQAVPPSCPPTKQGRIVCNIEDLDQWQSKLESKAVVVGSCFGPRPPVEHLKTWMSVNWGNRGLTIPHVQYLPNGYFVFMFEEPEQAQFVLSHGTWLFKNSPLLLQAWTRDFNPRGARSSIIPVWVDFPEMPLQFYPWLKELGSQLGKSQGINLFLMLILNGNLSCLLKFDTSLTLKEEILIMDGEGEVLHVQKVVYRNLPNACFHCLKQGHLIRDCPALDKRSNVDDQGFQNLERRGASKKDRKSVV